SWPHTSDQEQPHIEEQPTQLRRRQVRPTHGAENRPSFPRRGPPHPAGPREPHVVLLFCACATRVPAGNHQAVPRSYCRAGGKPVVESLFPLSLPWVARDSTPMLGPTQHPKRCRSPPLLICPAPLLHRH